MKIKQLFFSGLLTALLCVVGTNRVVALDYNCVVTNVSVTQSDEITRNQFTLTINQKGVNSGGTSYTTSLILVLESNDRTLDGTYSTLSSATDKIISGDLTYGSNIRELNSSTSKFKINKVSEGHYSIGDPSSNTNCQLHFKQTSPSNSTTYNYFYSY